MIDLTVFSRNRIEQLRITLRTLYNKIEGSDCRIVVSLNDYSVEDCNNLKIEFKEIVFVEISGASHDENMRNAIASGDQEYFWILSDDDDYEDIDLKEILKLLKRSKADYLFVNYMTISDGNSRRSRFKPHLFGNLNKMRFAYSLCSANIVNRKSWYQHAQERFFNTNFWHLHTISNIISAPNSLALSTSKPMIKNIGPSISESRNEHGFEFYAKAWKASIQIAQSLDCSYLTRLHLMSICLITVHWNLYTEKISIRN